MQFPLYLYNHKTGTSRDEKEGGAGLERGALNLKELYEIALSHRKIEKYNRTNLMLQKRFTGR